MKKQFLIFIMGGLLCFQGTAQDAQPKRKIFNHYVGVQANQLLKQLLSLSNSAAVENPYLLTYTLSFASTGVCLNTGFGYNYNTIADNLTPANHETKNSELAFRIGLGKRFQISRKFEAGLGLDYLINNNTIITTSSSVINFGSQKDSLASVVTTREKGKGYGLQGNLAFHISERILLGTEFTYYYTKTKNQSNTETRDYFISLIDPSQNEVTFSNANHDTEEKELEFTVPVSLFLIIKF